MNNVTRAAVWAAMTLMILATRPTFAAEREARPDAQPTVITSDRMEFDYREYVALFEGNVKVKDPQFDLTSDRLLVFFEGTNDVRQVNAIGNVTVVNEGRTATCDSAVYVKAREQIVMSGNARLQRGGDDVRGDQITIWLNDQRVLSVPGRLSIAPDTHQRRETGP